MAFSDFAVRESVSVRFARSTAAKVLAFFEKLQSSYENRYLVHVSLIYFAYTHRLFSTLSAKIK